mmetsp:Transcript_26924/g.38632  ORF Transcript_26924/g.38632 Transcript_26924/m.38632 type:complete len:118 (+) Transcript_26924:208-561(+)
MKCCWEIVEHSHQRLKEYLPIGKLVEHALLRPPVILGMCVLDIGAEQIYEISEVEEDGVPSNGRFNSNINSNTMSRHNRLQHSSSGISFSTENMLLWALELLENTWIYAVHRQYHIS